MKVSRALIGPPKILEGRNHKLQSLPNSRSREIKIKKISKKA
jgi:hypothetical protein